MKIIKEIKKDMLDEVTKLNIDAYKGESKMAGSYNKYRKQYIAETFNKGKMFGYFDNGKLMGAAGIIIHSDKGGEIRHLFVIKEHRKEGIGGKLLEFIEDFARKNKVKRIKFDTQLDNKTAINFYEKRGYKTYSINMEKWLKNE